jgi:NADH-quinone oxidoreductase subunit D
MVESPPKLGTTVQRFPGEVAGSETMVLNMGPQHPSTHGVLRLVLELEGEIITKCVPHIGYVHTGIEKTCESKTYWKFLPLTDRIDYTAPLANNHAAVLAVEKILNCEVPPRAQWVRVIMSELTRIQSHLIWLGTHGLDLGGMTVFFYAFREREKILDLFEMASGVRLMTTYFRIGGLREDLPDGWVEQCRALMKEMPSCIDEYEAMLTENEIFLERTQGVGVLSPEDAIDLGVSGPSIRGSGIDWDLRKSNPYSGYENFDFQIPIGTNCDTYDRYLVRMDEMRQSVKIIQQGLDGLPGGPVMVNDRKIALPPREELHTSMESLIHHFKLVTEGIKPPKGEAYECIESPKGMYGCYVVSDGTHMPARVHFRTPSFVNLQAFPKLMEGRLVADAVAVIGSIDIVLGEVDR